MAQYSKKRGVKYDQKKLSLEEKRKQWNIDLANRTLEQMFGCVEVGEDEIINNRCKKRIVYNAETLYEKGMEYFQNIVESNENNVVIVPDIEDFCMFCHISRTTFIKYRRGDDVTHGEAVAMGMVQAAALSAKYAVRDEQWMEICDYSLYQRFEDDFLAVGLPINCPYKMADMAELMVKDKKAEGGKIHFVLPAAVGDVRIVDMTVEDVTELMN